MVAGPKDRQVRRVLVTGADGLIGSAVVAELIDAGIAVTGLSLSATRPSIGERILTGDAADPTLVDEALSGCDSVVHLAAIPHPSLGRPLEVFAGNTAATFNVLERAAHHGIDRAVIASSINAHGVPMNPHPVRAAYYPIDEQAPIDLADWYSLAKHTDEHSAAMAHRRWGIDVVAVRFPLVKPHGDLVSIAREQEQGSRLQALAREGYAYLDVRDAVTVVRAGLTRPVRGAHVVLVAADDILLTTPTEDLLDSHAPEVPRRRRFPGRAGLIDTGRARRLLGWEPRWSVHREDGQPARRAVGDHPVPALTSTSGSAANG